MHNAIDVKREKAALEKVLGSAWGTIGPEFVQSGKAMAAYCKTAYGLTVFSASAAMETVLRAMNIGFGDEVIVASYSNPLDSMVTSAVGAAPVFADVCGETLTLTCEQIEKCRTVKTKAVIADLPAGNACDAKSLSAYCRNHHLYLIINMDDSFQTEFEGVPIAKYADAAVADLSQGKALSIGEGGAVLTDNEELFHLFFAYHNCGRPFGEGCTLAFDELIGGDLRIAEWQACLIAGRLQEAERIARQRQLRAEKLIEKLDDSFRPVEGVSGGASSFSGLLLRCRPDSAGVNTLQKAMARLQDLGVHGAAYYPVMHRQPFFTSPCFIKLTGRESLFDDRDYENSISAAATVIYVGLA